ncbi:hypothetical protein [Sinisalibacter lacisalsi]|uniref:Uncharacterized protein n=1 Tax=Sinisalibacter lacisalsi TaxID=1526570 RepID=A0ABQ1QQU1_9RHOB|nr:hypothetical protein [Sinisalibacter lacisalsi]GGD40126.1 hypothetical protein GCM10011358_25070 [Sinisalibacter lacisalsi]
MVEELVIHIGDCKTGTTSIQTTLALGQFVADGRDLVYPTRFNHIPFAKKVAKGPSEALGEARQLARAFHKSDAAIGVISAEHFEYAGPSHLAALFDGPFKPWRDRVRVISYIRPHAERFLSSFAERSKKGGFGENMERLAENLLNQELLFYAPRVAKWQAAFGEHYTVRPFIRDLLEDGDVVRDFFSFVFGETPVSFRNRTAQNESLSLEDLVLMRHTQSLIQEHHPNAKEAGKALGWNFSPILSGLPAEKSTKIRLHQSLARQLQDTYAEDAAALDALAFEGTPMTDRLSRAVEDAIAEPQSLRPEDHHSPEVLRLAEAHALMLGRIMAANPAHFRWATRPREFRAPLREIARQEPRRMLRILYRMIRKK